MEKKLNILEGDALINLKKLRPLSVDCVLTSPPYWNLRDYEITGQLGLEKEPDMYIKKLCDVFDEIKKILKNSGSLWINIGDTYSSNSSYSKKGRQGFIGSDSWNNHKVISEKSLIGIPFKLALEMIKRGWILRNTIIWHKPNAMPSSAKDRFTVDFEYIFFFVKSKKYYFNQILETFQSNNYDRERMARPRKEYGGKWAENNKEFIRNQKAFVSGYSNGRNKRCVWKVATEAFEDNHFAVYPEELCKIILEASCPKKGLVLDPFMGSGTTGLVALKQEKNFVGIEINPDYIRIAEKRLKPWKEQTRLENYDF